MARTRTPPVGLLGLLGILGSPGLLVVWLMGGFQHPDPPPAVLLAQLAFLAGWACSVLGLQRLSAAGAGRGRALLWAQLFGVCFAATQELQDLFLAPPDRAGLLYRAADAAWPLSVLLMVAVGAAIIRAGVLRGWRRLPALACGLALPLASGVGAFGGQAAMAASFAILTAVSWAGLGCAVVLSGTADRDREAALVPVGASKQA